MSAEVEIRQAVDRFYEALDQALNGDPAPMQELWARGPEVTAMHPAGGRQLGDAEVRRAWEQWTGAVTNGRIEPAELIIRLITPDVAYVTGVERGGGEIAGEFTPVDSRVTLLLRREGREWKAVHHHVDVAPAVAAAVARLMAGAAA